MTTQATATTVGSGAFSKIFNLTSTDGTWSNSQTDSISSQPLGILIPNATITNVCSTYTAGLAAWRIQDAQSLQVKRRGFSSKVGYSCYDSCRIPAYKVNPNDILTIYPLPIDATSSQSNVMAWVTTSKGTELFKAQDVADSTSTAMTTVVNGQSLGDNMFGSTLSSVVVQGEDDSTVNQIDIIDNSGAVVFTAYGGTRNAVGSMSNYYNLDVSGMGIAIGRGWAIKVTMTSA